MITGGQLRTRQAAGGRSRPGGGGGDYYPPTPSTHRIPTPLQVTSSI